MTSNSDLTKTMFVNPNYLTFLTISAPELYLDPLTPTAKPTLSSLNMYSDPPFDILWTFILCICLYAISESVLKRETNNGSFNPIGIDGPLYGRIKYFYIYIIDNKVDVAELVQGDGFRLHSERARVQISLSTYFFVFCFYVFC